LGGGETSAEEAAAGLFHVINIARMIKSQKMTWLAGKAYQMLIEDPKEIKYLGHQSVDDKIIVQQILKNKKEKCSELQ
jgi:hypothetical protein